MDIRKMTTRILVLMLFCSCACAQEIPTISFKIKGDSLVCSKPCNTVRASLIIRNDSDNDILVYGLKRGGPGPAFGDLLKLCDVTRTGTGIQFALYHHDGNREMPEYEIVDYWKRRPVTKGVLDSAFRAMNKSLIESARVLKKHDTIMLVREVPLENFNLRKGLYYLQFVYYCGNKTAEVLNSNKVKRQATLFQGCATTAKIPFVVDHERKAK